jgi:twitching motility protein PilT
MAHGILHEVLALGVGSNASDWHIKENAPVALRIAGKLVDTDLVPDSDLMDKIIEEMIEGDERLRSKYFETGDLDISYVEEEVGRFRVNIHKQRGEKGITMRHVKTEIMNFEQLGVPPVIEKLAESERGIIIISGTTGSGKSTTLAAMMQHMNNNFRRHIITVEDPIEYEFFDNKSFFEQREVGLDTISFYSALVHALRQDPDVIMVGEMRDKESFEAALQAADTGHLVMTTLHSSTASQAVNRILDFYEHAEQGPIREALSVNLRAIVAQRLLPRAFGGGVVPTIEVMINTPLIQKLLTENRLDKLAGAIAGSRGDGMQSFNQSLYGLINNGDITEEDAMRSSSNPEALKMNLKGIFLDEDNKIIG